MRHLLTLLVVFSIINLANSQNVGVGASNPETTLHVRAGITPTIKIQADGNSEESGRISLRRDNESGIDMYYDGTKADGLLIFESYIAGQSTGKILTLNETNRKVILAVTAPIPSPSKTLVVAADGTIGTKQKYVIGDAAFGGVIFWLDESGEHGLVVAYDEFTGPWTDDFAANTSFANSNGINGGILNTTLIILAAGGNSNAGAVCGSYQGGSYGDWYLPSEYETIILFETTIIDGDVNQAIFDGGGTALTETEYWTSQEEGSQFGIAINFSAGTSQQVNKADDTNKIRPIRAF